MVAPNVISIEVETTDKAGLAKLAKDAHKIGQEIEQGLGRGFDAAERKARDSGEKMSTSMRSASSKIDKSVDMTARQIGRYLYQIERDAWHSGAGIDDAFSTSMRKVRDDLNQVRADAAKTGAGLESELGAALKKVSAEADELRKSVQKPSQGKSDSGSMVSDLLGNFSSVKGGALALGGIVGGLLWQGVQTEWEKDSVGGLLAAQIGATSAAAESLGDTAGKIFGDNFGDSIDQVGEAMHAVFEQKLVDPHAANSAIESMTEKVITLAQVSGESFDKVARDSMQMVKTGLVDSIGGSMNLIGAAVEHGLNAADDLFDTIEEYSTKFRDLGLNGQQAFGLIEQAMDAGARNTDIAADALKEFSIRAQDGSVLTRQGFEAIGLDADVMGQMVAKGGQSATDALRQTLNALQGMPPSVERSTAAVDLFGTKAEDLGDALYHMDLDNAADKFDNISGTIDDMMHRIGDSANVWEQWGRKVSTVAGNVTDAMTDVKNVMENAPSLTDIFGGDDEMTGDPLKDIGAIRATIEDINKGNMGSIDVLRELKKQYPEAAGAIDAYIKKKESEKQATEDTTSSSQAYIDTLDKMLEKQRNMANPVLELSSAQRDYQQSLADVADSLEKNHKGLDITTEGGRANKEALDGVAKSALDVAQAMSTSGASVSDVNNFLQTAHDQLVQSAIDLGMGGDEAEAYARSLGLIPRSVLTYAELQANAAIQNLAAYQRALDNIPRTITTTTYVRGANTTGSGGRMYLGQEHGGIVTRPHWAAASGGQRHGSTLINEAGPEVAELPNGTRMLTAGASRAMAEAGMLGGGGPQHITIVLEAGDATMAGIMAGIRVRVKDDHGGSVQAALGQRGAA